MRYKVSGESAAMDAPAFGPKAPGKASKEEALKIKQKPRNSVLMKRHTQIARK